MTARRNSPSNHKKETANDDEREEERDLSVLVDRVAAEKNWLRRPAARTITDNFEGSGVFNIEWVDRKTIMKQLTHLFIEYNVKPFLQRNSHSGSFRYGLFCGPSGNGKTRTAMMMLELLQKQSNPTNLGFPTNFKVVPLSILLAAQSLPAFFTNMPVADPRDSRPRNKSHVDKAGNIFAASVAASYHFGHSNTEWVVPRLLHTDLVDHFGDLLTVIHAIRKEQQLVDGDVLVLAVQVDEFQRVPYLTLNMLRYIDSIRTNCQELSTLLVPLLSGLAVVSLETVEDVIGPSGYNAMFIRMPPLDVSTALSITANQTRLLQQADRNGGSSSPVVDFMERYGTNVQLRSLCQFAVPLPRFAEWLGSFLHQQRYPELTNAVAVDAWTWVVSICRERYPRAAWELMLGQDRYARQLICFSFFKVPVNRSTRVNGDTLGAMEQSGLLLLEESLTLPGEFTIALAPIFLHLLDVQFSLDLFLPILFQSFIFPVMNQDQFPLYVLAVHRAAYRLLPGKPSSLNTTNNTVTVTVKEIYRDSAQGGVNTLSRIVSLTVAEAETMNIRNVLNRPGDEYKHHHLTIDRSLGHYADTKKRGKVVLTDTAGTVLEPIVIGKHCPTLIVNSFRERAAECITPHGDEQYKTSDYVISGRDVAQGRDTASKYISLALVKEEREKSTADVFALISPKPFTAFPESIKKLREDPEYSGVVLVCGREALQKLLYPFGSDAVCGVPSK